MASKRPSLKTKKPKERWLLTRKTWRYMADAGRRLIPEGTLDKPEEVPIIEANFQDVCHREKKFLLWRKCSYPSALKHPRPSRRHTSRSKDRAGSATELELGPVCSRLRDNRGRNSLPGAQRVGPWSPLGHHQKTGKSYHGDGNEAVFEAEEESYYDEMEASALEERRKEISGSGGVKKKLSHFWRGTADTNKQGSVRLKSQHGKSNKSSDSEENVPRVKWQSKKTAENDNDDNAQRSSHKSRSRKVSKEVPDNNIPDYRARYGHLRRLQSEQDHTTLKNVDRDTGNLGNLERSLSADHRISSQSYSHGSREYNFEEESESCWSLDRTSLKEKHRHDLTTTNSYMSNSSDRLVSRHNLTLPGLTLARPARSTSHHLISSDLGTSYTSKTLRTRRSGKVENDFHSFQTHLSHWKPSDRTTEGSEHYNDSSLDLTSSTKKSSGCKTVTKPIGPKFFDQGVQTLPISNSVMISIESELRLESKTPSRQPSPTPPIATGKGARRKSSVDSMRGVVSVTEDCSPSVGDTILRYLRMARKKSVDSDKADRFRTVNYDRTLRYIKSKPPIEDDNVKNIQTDESWLRLTSDPHLFEVIDSGRTTPHQDDLHLFSSDQESSDLGFASSSRAASSRSSFDAGELSIPVPTYPTSPQSPAQSPSTGHSFLSQLLHGLQQAAAASNPMSLPTAMQKSKSSSSVGHHGPRLMAKKIWRTRSKSQSRATPSTTSTWTPQGQCRWSSVTGRSVTLQPTSLLQLSDLERTVLQQVALAKLQALNLGVNIRIPSEEPVAVAPKPKRRAYLLKRKALTTGFFDTGRKDGGDKEKEGTGGSGLVFGIPLSQCIANDRLSEARSGGSAGAASPAELRRRSHHGSRTSFSSLVETARGNQSGSCESLPASASDGRPGVAGSVPGQLDVLSLQGGGLNPETWECSPSVPHVVATCCRHIMQHGLHTLGIFRVSSSKKRVRQLREDLDCGKDPDLNAELCPHDTATLLKEFFRDLPDPLMSRELYPAFLQTQRIRNRRLQFEALQHLVQLLPVANRDTLSALLAFLNTVARHSADRRDTNGEWLLGNKMDSANLATLFAPNILHCFRAGSAPGSKEAAAERPEDRTDSINVTRAMIDHNYDLFEITAEILDEVYLHMMDSHPDALDQLLRKLCFGGDEMADDGDNNSVFEGSESSSVPRTPTEPSASLDDKAAPADASRGWADASRKVYTREEFLHETAGMGGPDMSMNPRHRDRGRERSKKRGKEDGAEGAGSSSRWFSHHQGSKKREKSSSDEGRRRSERGSSSSGGGGIPSEPATPISSPSGPIFSSRSPSVDESQASTIISVDSIRNRTEDNIRKRENNSGSGNIITASLKIPVPHSATSFALSLDDIPYIEDERTGATSSGRRSVDSVPSSLHTTRPSTDSAIGSTISPPPGSEAPFTTSGMTSPSMPESPTPGDESPHLEDESSITTTGRILIPTNASSTKVTTTTVIRKVEVTSSKSAEKSIEVSIERRPSIKISKEDKKKYTRRRYTDNRHPTTQFPDVEALESAATSVAHPGIEVSNPNKGSSQSSSARSSTVWKRREIIASVATDPKDHETFV